MSADAQHLAPIPPSEVPDNTERLLTFLRQETAAQRDALREDAKANRDMLIGATRIIAIPVTAAIVLVGWLGWKSFSDLKGQLAASATEQIKTETLRMQSEIRKKLTEEFQTPNIQRTVKESAQDATQKAAAPLIKDAVTREVQVHFVAERPQIHATVVSEAKKSVLEMQPQIDAEITKQANAAEARIQAQITPYSELIKASTLAALARNGMGTSFDELMKMSNSAKAEPIQGLVVSTRNAMWLQYEDANGGVYLSRQFNPKKTKEELLPLLSNSEPITRKAAIDELALLNEKSIVPVLLMTMRNDPFIVVRVAAFHALIQLTGQKFNPLDDAQWEQWWEKNKSNWPPK